MSSIHESAPSPHDPVPLFHANAPDGFLRDVLQCVVKGWNDADQKTRDEFDEPERHDLFPHHRRAIIERELRGVAKRHGLTGSPQKNRRKTSSFTQLVSGRVILTASAVREPDEIVRYADFRLTFARNSQLCLFGEPEPVLPNAPLYALVLHGPGAVETDEEGNSFISSAKPGFVKVVFPAPVAGSKAKIEYVGSGVDLLARFPDVVAGDTVVKPEIVHDVIEAKLRKPKGRKEAGA